MQHDLSRGRTHSPVRFVAGCSNGRRTAGLPSSNATIAVGSLTSAIRRGRPRRAGRT